MRFSSSLVALLLLLPSSLAFCLRTTTHRSLLQLRAGGGSTIPVHLPVGPDGAGVYSAETAGCFDVIRKATPLVMESLEQILQQQQQSDESSLFTVCDYGTADAGTSLGLVHQVCTRIRDETSSTSIQVIYEDQPTNEWQSVFGHFHGTLQAKDAYGRVQSTPSDIENVYGLAAGTSFFHQIVAPSTVDLGISFTAMHWLSVQPNSLKGHEALHAAQVLTDKSLDDALVQAETKQAAQDWLTILQHRASELKPGGRLVCVNFCRTQDGHFLGKTTQGANMWESFRHSWHKLHQDGLIDNEEAQAVSFPNYYRTQQEFIDGIDQVDGLQLISCEEHIVPCPYRTQWTNGDCGDNNMTPAEYAAWFVPTTRTWSHATFAAALHSDRTDKEQVLEQFWQNYQDLVAQDPSQHGMDYVHCYLVLEKV